MESLPTLNELKSLDLSVQNTSLCIPLDLKFSWTCEHTSDCDCVPTISCPLCVENVADKYHFECVHWSKRKLLSEFTIVPCYLKHAGQTKISIEHWHCPSCSLITHDPKHLSLHYEINHELKTSGIYQTDKWYSLSDEWKSDIDPDAPSSSKVKLSNTVSYRGFPLSMSYLEQLGCNVGEVLTKSKRPEYTSIYTILNHNHISVQSTCFTGLCFLIFGQGIPADFIYLINQAGGSVSGAQYSDSPDWKSRITHVLYCPDICLSRNAKIKRCLTSNSAIACVDCDWVIECLRSNSIQPTCAAASRIKTYLKVNAPILSSPAGRKVHDENEDARNRRSRRLSAVQLIH